MGKKKADRVFKRLQEEKGSERTRPGLSFVTLFSFSNLLKILPGTAIINLYIHEKNRIRSKYELR